TDQILNLFLLTVTLYWANHEFSRWSSSCGLVDFCDSPTPLTHVSCTSPSLDATDTLFARDLGGNGGGAFWGKGLHAVMSTYLACRDGFVAAIQEKLPAVAIYVDFTDH